MLCAVMLCAVILSLAVAIELHQISPATLFLYICVAVLSVDTATFLSVQMEEKMLFGESKTRSFLVTKIAQQQSIEHVR